jgi:hypothetical protein
MNPEKARPALDAGWIPVFGKDHAPRKKLERDDDSNKSHHALAEAERTPDKRLVLTERGHMPSGSPADDRHRRALSAAAAPAILPMEAQTPVTRAPPAPKEAP